MNISFLKSNNYKTLPIIKIIINYSVRENLAMKKLKKIFKNKILYYININTLIFQ